MGGSLRRKKRLNPTIKKRKHKKPFKKSDLPKEIAIQAPLIKEKLGINPEWNKAVHAEENYQKIGFATDVNVGTGRNRKNVDLIAAKAADLPEDDAVIDANLDDDLKVAMAKQRSTGKAPPKRPTPRQRHFVQQLVAAHGSDVDAMVRNVKINKMQHSKGQLMELIESVEYWAGKTGVDFRVPVKGLWRP